MAFESDRLKYQPKYKFGQKVVVEVITIHTESRQEFKNEVIGFIHTIMCAGTEKETTYEYGISTDLPAAYYNGNNPFVYILEKDIKIVKENER